MTIFEYLANILSAVKGVRTTELQEVAQLGELTALVRDVGVDVDFLDTAVRTGEQNLAEALTRGNKNLNDLIVSEVGAFGIDIQAIKKMQAEHTVLLQQILEAVTPLPAVRIQFDVTMEGQQTQEGVLQVTIKDNQKFDVSLSFTDAKGNAASVQKGSVAFVGFAGVSITPDPTDETKASVSADGPLVTGQISASADADLGDGVKTITGVLDVEVVAGDATVVQLNAGPATDQ